MERIKREAVTEIPDTILEELIRDEALKAVQACFQ